VYRVKSFYIRVETKLSVHSTYIRYSYDTFPFNPRYIHVYSVTCSDKENNRYHIIIIYMYILVISLNLL